MAYDVTTKKGLKYFIIDLAQRTIERTTAASIKEDLNGTLIISGINCNRLAYRMKNYYGDKKPFKLFIPIYNKRDLEKFESKKIARGEMRINAIKVLPFFALEASIIFGELAVRFNDNSYRQIHEGLKKRAWLRSATSDKEFILDTTPLENLRYTLKDYQLEFIKEYYNIKNKNKLDGFILSFDQGLGKTLTSISLAECLGKKAIYIICPNSLKENWAYEIKSYYNRYDNEKLWKEEVGVIGNPSFPISNKTRFFITNQEAIEKLFPYIKEENNMIIVDESHNFRALKTKRSEQLFELKKRLKCTDVLMMSGTPIKGAPNEIAPSLKMIDKYFTDEVAEIYNRCFNVSTTACKEIVRARLDRVIYRKTKADVLRLPKKTKHELKLRVQRPEIYLLGYVHENVDKSFKKKFKEELAKNSEYSSELIKYVDKYSSASKDDNKRFINLISSINLTDKSTNRKMHELDEEFMLGFTREYILPNINNMDEYTRVKFLQAKFLNMKRSCLGRAIGEVLTPARTNMYNDMYDENRDQIVSMIHQRTKKTIIFTSLLKVANHIHDDLNKNTNLNAVKIVGSTKDRLDVIDKFKNDDSIDVLIATTQTLSTGFTITEASQIFFFGTPWRSADFEQACDRIYRIGQTDDVDIYTCLLNSFEPNLSDRINEIIEWSGDMFVNMIEKKVEQDGENSW